MVVFHWIELIGIWNIIDAYWIYNCLCVGVMLGRTGGSKWEERRMKATVDVEVIPIWFIKKWCKERCDTNSALNYWIIELLKEWDKEERKGK